MPFESAAVSGVDVSTDEGVFRDRPSFVAPAMLAVLERTGFVDVVSWAGTLVADGALFDAGGGDNGLPEVDVAGKPAETGRGAEGMGFAPAGGDIGFGGGGGVVAIVLACR